MSHSGRMSLQQKRTTKSRQRDVSVSYDEEEISGYSFDVDSGDFAKNPNVSKNCQKTSSYEIRKEINTSDDTEEDAGATTTDIIRPRRSSFLENKTTSELRKGSNEFRSDGAFKYDEIESPEILEKKRKRRLSRRRRSENRSLETSKDLEENKKKASSRTHGTSTFNSEERNTTERSRKKGPRSIHGKKGEGEKVELPIAEILKKAQENNRTKYEEPIPLTELKSDTIYVQGRNGFSAMKITRGRSTSKKKVEKSAESYSHPIRVAIVVQKVWKCTGFICQGLLAGMAFMHFILMQTYFNNSYEFLHNYSYVVEIYTNIFSFLLIMCLIVTFDKFDIAHLDGEHLRKIYMNEAKSAAAILFYLITFCLHQVSLRVDDKLSLIYYNGSSNSITETTFKNESGIQIPLNEMTTWQRMTLSKDVLAVLAWFFVCLGTRDDMLLMHLETMEKYAEILNPTT
ncbi:uncharacterized protein LOC122512736 isoform X1 [Leptopilina heterotoma]|uniref:uncharacterized protein LOC122512736 isoform X1 n=1 Tax=Leptopilina heterotoma TaxID=63436 RepID=UPI001CA9F7B4|nr:uncharacterized protein LOC122512736 isoform X1 [Leptopilina heterotoma]